MRYFFLAAFFLAPFFFAVFLAFLAFFFAMSNLTNEETEMTHANVGVGSRSLNRTLTRLLTPASCIVTP